MITELVWLKIMKWCGNSELLSLSACNKQLRLLTEHFTLRQLFLVDLRPISQILDDQRLRIITEAKFKMCCRQKMKVIRELDLTGSKVTNLDSLNSLPCIKHITLDDTKFFLPNYTLHKIPWIKNLTSLSMQHTMVTDNVLNYVSIACVCLENLDISFCTHVSDDGLKLLEEKKLLSLNVTGCVRLTGELLETVPWLMLTVTLTSFSTKSIENCLRSPHLHMLDARIAPFLEQDLSDLAVFLNKIFIY